MTSRLVLVTGATGYVGGRLITELLSAGLSVRVLVRDKARVSGHVWAGKVEVIEGDANNPADLQSSLVGVHTAFYLLHSLNTGPDFASIEYTMAQTFATAAKSANISQIIYLGGISNDAYASKHLNSRTAVGDALKNSGIPTIELRAGMIIGSGSASFEMLRHLTHRLPIMTTPKWIHNRTHPIAIRDVLWYLKEVSLLPQPVSGIYDMGGPDILTYAELMQAFAKISDLPKRIIISVPVLTPTLASHWIGLVTPLPRSLAKNLVQSLISEVVADERKNVNAIVSDPPGGCLPVREAISLALSKVNRSQVDTRWSDSMSSTSPWSKLSTDPDWAGVRTYSDERTLVTNYSAEQIWPCIEKIGGATGWYGADILWSIRGAIDTVFGGVGLRRGRRDPMKLRVGDSLDFWRVEAIEQGTYLRLNAEMKLPGDAWLEFFLSTSSNSSETTITQKATFIPRGILGHLYWNAIAPFHFLVFPTMIKNLVKEAGASA